MKEIVYLDEVPDGVLIEYDHIVFVGTKKEGESS